MRELYNKLIFGAFVVILLLSGFITTYLLRKKL